MLPFVITYGGRLVGQINVSNVVHGVLRSCTVGYWVDRAVAGRGIAPTALALVIDHCFAAVGLHRVEVDIRPENAASLRVVEKLGLRREGYYERFLDIDGGWRDHVAFAVTVEELRGRSMAVPPAGAAGASRPGAELRSRAGSQPQVELLGRHAGRVPDPGAPVANLNPACYWCDWRCGVLSPMTTVFVLAVLWLIVVVPMVVRRNDERRRERSVDGFGRAMRALGRRAGTPDEVRRRGLRPARRAAPTLAAPDRRPVPAAQEALMYPVDRSEMSAARAQMMARRRRSLGILVGGSVVFALLALVMGGAMWLLARRSCSGFAGYV